MERADLLCLQQQILPMAEARFGPRDRQYTLVAPDFFDGPPNLHFLVKDKTVIQIRVNSSCRDDVIRACYQIAHECIHVLAPVELGRETVLEEGVATSFQHGFILKHCNCNWPKSGSDKYDAVRLLVERLLVIEPDSIRRLRQAQPAFSKITAAMIRQVIPSLAQSDADKLTLPFGPWSPA